jgi:hypothetical protein
LSILLDLMSRGINITIKKSLWALFWGQLLGGAFFLIGYLGGAGFSFFLCGRVGDSQLKVFDFLCFVFQCMFLGFRLLRCSSLEKSGGREWVGVVYAFTSLSYLHSSFLCSSLAMIVGHTYKQILLGIGVW